VQRSQLQELRRQNNMLQQQLDQPYQMPYPANPRTTYEQLQQQRCLTLPLGTPGC
jgi:hypothetical protein